MWKSIAVESGALPPLWIEDILNWRNTPTALPKVDAALCTGSAAARARGKEMADQYSKLSGAVVREIVSQRGSKLVELDAYFGVELAIMREIVCSTDGGRLLDEVKKVLPTMEQAVTPQACLVALARIQTTPLFKLSTTESQGKVEVVQTLVGRLASEQSPDVSAVQAVTIVMYPPQGLNSEFPALLCYDYVLWKGVRIDNKCCRQVSCRFDLFIEKSSKYTKCFS